MKRILLINLLAFLTSVCYAQPYEDSIAAFRKHYKQDFLTDARSPLKADDTAYLRFYAPDISYRFKGAFVPTPESANFLMATHSGKYKTFRQYGIVTFRVHDTMVVLHVYQNIGLVSKPEYADDLFIPFTDESNYGETFGGGRYLDLKISDVHGNELTIDFNKCYNPYCAFKDGYSCPIPPSENDIKVAIRAGEKLYGKQVNEN
ncbi:MAG: DUF1684 domain-containing protein [Taibaiella sp.]|nr:DUF1684 domain-containing protein [Taibaiella sp.]